MASASFEQVTKPSAVKELLLLIAALVCLISALLLLLSSPAHALTLSGEVAVNELKPVAVKGIFNAEIGDMPLPPDSTTLSAQASAQPVTCRPSSSFPVAFTGQWRCESLVVSSAVPEVVPGQRMISQVDFVQSDQGSVSMSWSQSGWTSTLTSLRVKGEKQATASRINQYMTGNWTAKSKDCYAQVSENQLVAESNIDQYCDGQFVGTYRTQSVLHRVEPMQAISLAK